MCYYLKTSSKHQYLPSLKQRKWQDEFCWHEINSWNAGENWILFTRRLFQISVQSLWKKLINCFQRENSCFSHQVRHIGATIWFLEKLPSNVCLTVSKIRQSPTFMNFSFPPTKLFRLDSWNVLSEVYPCIFCHNY